MSSSHQIVAPATPADDGRIIDVSVPSLKQFEAWAKAANDDAVELDHRAQSLERQAAQLLARAADARDAACALRACVEDKTILPANHMCRVCVAKKATSGFGCLMTNCEDCTARPLHAKFDAPFNHRSTDHLRKLLA